HGGIAYASQFQKLLNALTGKLSASRLLSIVARATRKCHHAPHGLARRPAAKYSGTLFMEIRAGVNLGRYQLLAEIGRGAAGTVYQALDPDIDRLVAIKIFSSLDATSDESEAFRELFAQEARAAGRLMHPSIVAVYDRGEEPETQTPYIVMEYVAGQPLSKLLSGSSSRIQERFALQIAKEIAEALAFAHDKGVV